MQRILPPTLVAGLFVAMVVVTLAAPWPELGRPVRLIGLLVLAVGLVINIRHAKLFDNVGTNINTFDDPDKLVMAGAFRWSRNPMYLGFLLMLIGIALTLGSAISMIGPALFFVAADRWYIPFEERRMLAIFGADYETYQRHVSRWIGQTST